jgi:hypothetical protein
MPWLAFTLDFQLFLSKRDDGDLNATYASGFVSGLIIAGPGDVHVHSATPP